MTTNRFTPEQPAAGFAIAEYTFEDLGRHGHGAVQVRVVGYWSHNPITVRVDRDWMWNRETGAELSQWKFDVSHSSVGRDTKEVAEDSVASRNFGRALIAAADEADKIRANIGLVQAAYEAEAALRKAEYEAEEAAKQAKIDADLSLGTFRASALVGLLVATAKMRADGKDIAHDVWARGADEDKPQTLCVGLSRAGSVMFVLAGTKMSKHDVVARLANMSARSANAYSF